VNEMTEERAARKEEKKVGRKITKERIHRNHFVGVSKMLAISFSLLFNRESYGRKERPPTRGHCLPLNT